MIELNAAVLAYVIYDYDKTLSKAEVIHLSKRIIYATQDLDCDAKAALEYIHNNPQYGLEL